MKIRRAQFGMVFMLASFLLMGLIMVNSCKKSEPAAPAEPEKAVSATIQQTTCPIMGGAINKDIFTEYKGKKVYFCCLPCKGKFKAEPEKYVAKLPQFSKEQ